MSKRIAMGGLALAAVLWAGQASAHVGHGESSFALGFAHPWGGFDHLAAMAAVGWAAAGAQAGRGSLMRLALVPGGFLAAMALGAAIAWAGVGVGWAELGILGSLIVVAGLLAIGASAPLWLAALLAFAAGLPHGAAHAVELPTGASALTFLAGFMLASALLHGLGVTLGAGLARLLRGRGEQLLRLAGGASIVALAAALAG